MIILNDEKPSWDHAPYWAKFLAQDASGDYNWFELKPYVRGSKWFFSGDGVFTHAKKCAVNGDWRESLERRPSKDKRG